MVKTAQVKKEIPKEGIDSFVEPMEAAVIAAIPKEMARAQAADSRRQITKLDSGHPAR
jgi:hypothetical protein